jgi:hypothetical protein
MRFRSRMRVFAIHARAGALRQSLESPGDVRMVDRRYPVMGAAGYVALRATARLSARVA